MRPKSLAARLFVGAAVWLAVAIAVGGVVLAEAFRESVERGFEQRLNAIVRAVIAGVTIAADGSVTVEPQLGEPRFGQLYSGWYWQVSARGEPIARSRSLWDFALPVADAAGMEHTRNDRGPRDEPLLVVERDIEFPQRAEPLHVIVGASRADIDAEVGRFRFLLGLSLGGLGLGLLAAIAIQVRYGMLPLRALAADLERLRLSSGARLGGDYPREIQPLIQALNQVLDHDAALIERARTHVGNLAHGLKTPLAILKAEAESRGGDPVVEKQVAIMLRLVEHHLGRARTVASSATALGARVPVAEVTAELTAMMAKIYADKHLDIACRVDPTATALVDREDLAEMLGNLLDNACKHARHSVRVTCRREGDRLAIAVDDDGPGMTEEEAAEASRRGARLDEAVEGWGLGLSIVADLAALHDGRLSFGRSDLGGLSAQLALRAPPTSAV